ncbi:MAG: hypothetical protein KDC92_04660 [Bacteroidetes bacterium]|nr:hypothetical protein [Bacteroidota bacterium]
MKRLIIVGIFSLIIFLANAQVSGYLGKRFLFELDFAAMPDLGNYIANDTSNQLINTQFGFSGQFVRAKKAALGVHYRFQQSTHDLRLHWNNSFINNAFEDLKLYNYKLESAPSNMAITNMHHIGFGFLSYDDGFVAPAGNYTEAEFGVIAFSTYFWNETDGTIWSDGNEGKGIAPYFRVNRMRNHIMLDALVLSFGWSATFNPLGIYSAYHLSRTSKPSFYADTNILYHHGLERTMETGYFMFKIGLGLLK